MKVAILHDYLHTYGGAERVLESILRTFPDAVFFSSCYYPSKVKIDFSGRKTHYSYLNKLPLNSFSKELISKASFNVFSKFDLSEFDVVITSTSGPANWIKKREGQKVISYFHKIPSFQFRSSKTISESEKIQAKNNSKNLFSKFRDSVSILDREYAAKDRVYVAQIDKIISNSFHYSKNFGNIYEKNPSVIYPPLQKNLLEYIKEGKKFPKEDYYVYFGRLEEYKGIKEIVEACILLKKKLKVIGVGSLSNTLPKSEYISYLGFISDKEKFEIISKAKAFINGSKEDFGIVFLESLSLSTPIITLKGGGIHEISKDKFVTYFERRSVSEIVESIKLFESKDEEVSPSFVGDLLNEFSEENFSRKLLQVVNE